MSLVAVGGEGKTALAERVLHDLCEQSQFGVFAWSFEEESSTVNFLVAATEYFTGETPTSTGGLLARLKTALTGDEPHFLVLDGLDKVQTVQAEGASRGKLEDPKLRQLLCWLAAGHGTRTRVLVTSRFALRDLNNWKLAGYRERRLLRLDEATARAIMRGWGVKGDDPKLDALAESVGYHSLSVAALGSYLGNVWCGDPTKAPAFDRGEMTAADPKAAKLARILTEYAEKLSTAERDLLVRVCLFPRGVTVECLCYLIDAGGRIAGTLAGYTEARLLALLHQLCEIGLVFRFTASPGTTFSTHPFIRHHFHGLLTTRHNNRLGWIWPPFLRNCLCRLFGDVTTRHEMIVEAVRARLAANVALTPTEYPSAPDTLNKHEFLIECTRLAGNTQRALEIYWHALGNYDNLGCRLGDNARGKRVLLCPSHPTASRRVSR